MVVKKKTTTKAQQDDSILTGDEVLVTEEGLKKLKDELAQLETSKRKEIAERLQEAIAYGDLSENSEYQEAKEEQAFTEGRILELQRKIKNAKVISHQHGGMLNLGSQLEIKATATGEVSKFTIVGSTEVDPFSGKISNESPLGQALLGRKNGDVVVVEAPGGKFEYSITKVS